MILSSLLEPKRPRHPLVEVQLRAPAATLCSAVGALAVRAAGATFVYWRSPMQHSCFVWPMAVALLVSTSSDGQIFFLPTTVAPLLTIMVEAR